MAQTTNNTVKTSFGSGTTLPRFMGNVNPSPAFKQFGSSLQVNPLNNTLGPRKPNLAFPAMGALGVQPRSGNALGTSGAPARSSVVSTSTPQYNQGNSMSGRDSQITGIQNGVAGVQGLLDQRKAADAASKSKGTTGSTNTGTSNDTSLKGILSSIMGASRATKEQERTRREMENIARGNQAIGDAARATSQKYGQEIARVGALGAGAVAGNLSTGTNVVGSGNAAIASQSASSRMNALAQGLDAELKGSAQQLTGQDQMANAFNPSLQASLTQQSQQLSGLGTAGGLASPLSIPYSAGGFDPVTGQQIAGGLGGYAGYNAAQQAFDLTGQYPDAGVQYDPNLSPQENLQRIQQAIGGSASYQRGTFGTAGANSYIGAQQLGAAGNLTGQVAQIQTMGAAADSNFNLMLDILKRGGINDFNQPVLNQLQQGLSRGLTSNEDVVAFRSGLQTVRSQYAAILGGGTPTDATQAMAAEKIPDTVSLGALQEVERTMKTMVNNTVAAYNQQIGAYSNQGGGGNSFAEQW